MTVREFAERVLFSDSLEEKLAPPSDLVDDARGTGIATPDRPGRPPELKLQRAGVRAEFPGMGGIEDDAQRGRLLHFFANHELLATELMALVLLKFPDAPAEFRAGIVRTLKEEQMHTKLYLKRMAECGVAFGDLPVNGFFWNAVAPMPTPVDYVTRLSLTFEQANLDYARGYAAVFQKAGDRDTAALLTRIYQDEIGHVSYGLEWFRRWKKDARISDWKVFLSRLDLPLSAARAKGGFAFNEEGRREAGLDEEFIRELRVYAQSKGRTPNVYWFNPGAEESLVSTEADEPSRAAQAVERDLSILMAYLARKEDVVLVPELPPTAFLQKLLDAGIGMPELVMESDAGDVAERKLHELRPWARTPDAKPMIARLGKPCAMTAPELFSKAVHAEFLAGLLDESSCPLLGAPTMAGVVVSSIEELRMQLAKFESRPCVIKAPFSTAGRARLIREDGSALSPGETIRVEEMLQEQGELVVEPWLERLIDFSVQYDCDRSGRLRRRGIVVLANTPQGQFRSATVAERFTDFLEDDVRRILFAGASRRGHLFDFLEECFEPALSALLARYDYEGPLGVDSFLFRGASGEVRYKPVVEINPRYTMGRVAIELARFTPTQSGATLTMAKPGAGPQGALRLTPDAPGARFAAYLSSASASRRPQGFAK